MRQNLIAQSGSKVWVLEINESKRFGSDSGYTGGVFSSHERALEFLLYDLGDENLFASINWKQSKRNKEFFEGVDLEGTEYQICTQNVDFEECQNNCYLCIVDDADETPFDPESNGICIIHRVMLWELARKDLRFKMRGELVSLNIEQLNQATPIISTKKYIEFESPRHSWLRVSILELEKLDIMEEISPFSYRDEEFVYLEEDMDMGTFFMKCQIDGHPIDRANEIESIYVEDFPHLPNIHQFILKENENIQSLSRIKSGYDGISFPIIVSGRELSFEKFVPIILVETENDPVDFDALNIVCPNSNKVHNASSTNRNLIIKSAQAYAAESGLEFHLFFTQIDSLYISPDDLKANEETSVKYVHPKIKIGSYEPLVVHNAPLDLENPFKMTPDGKRLFLDGWGVRIKDIPGLVLNDGYPGSDGAVYSIDVSHELKKWDFYRCRRNQQNSKNSIEIERLEPSLAFDQLNSDHKSVRVFYDVLDHAGINLEGAEVIALGLPIHNGNF